MMTTAVLIISSSTSGHALWDTNLVFGRPVAEEKSKLV